MLWSNGRWKPVLTFSRDSLKSLFSFGSKLLLSGLIDTIYRNVYLLIIGKFFSAADLGYYTRADQFSRLASQNLTGTVQRVSFPVLSQVQDEDERLKSGYKRLILSTMFISFFVMLGLVAVAEPMIVTLIGEKWLPSVEYLQLISLGAMLYPLHALNLNILNVKGRSDLFLKLELLKKLLAVPVIIAGIFLGIRAMLIGMVILSFIAYFLNGYYSGRLIRFPVSEQIADIAPSFLAALSTSFVAYSLTLVFQIHPALMLLMQMTLIALLMVGTGRIFNLKGYKEIRRIIVEKKPKLGSLL